MDRAWPLASILVLSGAGMLPAACGGGNAVPVQPDASPDTTSDGGPDLGSQGDGSCGPRDAAVVPFDAPPNPDAGECGCTLGFDPDVDGGLEVVCCDPGERCCSEMRGCDDDPYACGPGEDWWIGCEWDWCSSTGCRCRERCCYCFARDCGTCGCLTAHSDNFTLAECEACQGHLCARVSDCAARFPCVDGRIELRGCCSDSDCAGLAPYCGREQGAHNVCVLNDCN